MKKEKAEEIARRFFEFRECERPGNMKAVYASPDGERFVFRASLLAGHCRSGIVYEIALDAGDNTISMRELLLECALSDFELKPCLLSELHKGDLFHFPAANRIYRYLGATERYGAIRHCFTSQEGGLVAISRDLEVYPCNR